MSGRTECGAAAACATLDEALAALLTSRLRVTLRARGDGALPADLGNLLRGCFGAALKTISGSAQGAASAYEVLFESPLPAGAPVLRNASHVPHPFVLRPPLVAIPTLRDGDELIFELVLLGERALTFYPQVLLAMIELGQRGLGQRRVPLELAEISEYQRDGSARELFGTRGPIALPQGEPLVALSAYEGSAERERDVTVELLSPAQIIIGGRVPRELSFEALVRALLRRVSSLCAFHGAGPLELDFGALLERAGSVETVESELEIVKRTRYSARQGRRTPQVGLRGRVRYRGAAIGELLPLLAAGERVHVGKGTGFGLGLLRVLAKNAGALSEPRGGGRHTEHEPRGAATLA